MAIKDDTTKDNRPDLADGMAQAAIAQEKKQDQRIANLERSVRQLEINMIEMRGRLSYPAPPDWMKRQERTSPPPAPIKAPENYFLDKLRDRKQELVNGLASLVQSKLWEASGELKVSSDSVENFSVATENAVFSFSKVTTKDSEGWTVGVIQSSGVTNEVISHLSSAPYMMFKYI